MKLVLTLLHIISLIIRLLVLFVRKVLSFPGQHYTKWGTLEDDEPTYWRKY